MSDLLASNSISALYGDGRDLRNDANKAMRLALEMHALGLVGGNKTNENVPDLSQLEPPKKCQNTKETIKVPTSEHVAEIVGKQGCKIRILREKTNTYIKTPGRGEEPQFVITGRAEDVAIAAAEIREAAEHFTVIRAQRSRVGSMVAAHGALGSEHGTVTVKVRVPYKVVGLVVGPRGSTIKRIQNETHTYIVTPSREKDPVFEVTGLPENVEVAKQEIEAYIATRTGTGSIDRDLDFAANGVDIGDDGEIENPIAGNSSASTSERALAALQAFGSLSLGDRLKVDQFLQSLSGTSVGKPQSSPNSKPAIEPKHITSPGPVFPTVSSPQSESLKMNAMPPLLGGSLLGSNFSSFMLPDSTRNFLSNMDEPETKSSPPEINSLSLKSNFALYQKSLANPITELEPTDDTPQIVVNLKEIGVDLDKDVGRSIQKKEEEKGKDVDVSKSKLNPTAASWCPPATKVIKPIQKPSSVNLAPNFANSSKNRRTPPNIQKIAAGDGIYIQTKQKQTTLRSSRDMQNFPALNPGALPQAPNAITKKSPTTGQLTSTMTNSLLTRNLVRSPSPSDDTRSMATLESGYGTESMSDVSSVSGKALCILCHQNSRSAALVPCGHSSFCYTCALTIAAMTDARCPLCSSPVSMALKIK